LRAHGLLTFFLVMLLPGLPDNLACFAASLTRIPIRRLILAAVVGRFPATLTLALMGDSWSSTAGSMALYVISASALLLTGLYFRKKPKVEGLVRRLTARPTYESDAGSAIQVRLIKDDANLSMPKRR
jgi:uncharacterized membrane protein YdjX (TVP38/TMEM64 family)